MTTRPQGTPYRLRQIAGDFGVAAANIRARAAELQQAGAAAPADWGWSGPAAAAYSKTWQGWQNAAETVADGMDSSLPGARQVLNRLADELEAAQRLYDDAVMGAQTLGLTVDAKGYVTPRSAVAPAPLPAGSPEEQIEQQVAGAVKLGQQAFDRARDGLQWIFKDGWIQAIGRINTILGYPQAPLTLLQTGTTTYAGIRLYQTIARGGLSAAEAAQVFDEAFVPTAFAFRHGAATADDLWRAAALGLRRIEMADLLIKGADRASFLRGGAAAGGKLDLLGRLSLPFAVAGDFYTLHDPGPGPQWLQRTNQVAAGANLAGTAMLYVAAPAAEYLVAAGVINASLDWIPVVGEGVMVVTALALTAIWAYQNVQPFHDFCNAAGSDITHVASDTWNAASHGVSDAGHAIQNEAFNVSHSVSNAWSGATHAVTGFFHWP